MILVSISNHLKSMFLFLIVRLAWLQYSYVGWCCWSPQLLMDADGTPNLGENYTLPRGHCS